MFRVFMSNQGLLLKIKNCFGEIALFDNKRGFYEAVHGTPTVLERGPRCNFMKNIVFQGLSVDA
jgi:hypothetical protein